MVCAAYSNGDRPLTPPASIMAGMCRISPVNSRPFTRNTLRLFCIAGFTNVGSTGMSSTIDDPFRVTTQ